MGMFLDNQIDVEMGFLKCTYTATFLTVTTLSPVDMTLIINAKLCSEEGTTGTSKFH